MDQQQQQIQQVLAQHCTGAKGYAYGLSEEKVGSSLFNLSIPRKRKRKKYLVFLYAWHDHCDVDRHLPTELTQ